jgi:glutathione S-transferase
MLLYDSRVSGNCYKVRLLFAHLGVDYERREVDVIERHLDGRSFLVGERYTIADMALFAYTHVAHEGGFDLDRHRVTRGWLERVAAQPGHIPITA